MTWTPVILAAGESARMESPKALLDFGGATCLDLVLRVCRHPAATPPLVVLGHAAAAIRPTLPAEAIAVLNPDYRRGQTSSLQAGLRHLPPGAAGFLLFPVDFPLVRRETIDRILAAAGEIVVPTHGGRRGHPARFGRGVVGEILALGENEPVHLVVRRNPARVTEVPVRDSGVVRRLNTPEEYRECLRAYRRRSGAAAPRAD